MAAVIQFCNRCEERKYLKLCKKCSQYLCSECKREHLCGVGSGPSTLYGSSEHLIKEIDNKPFQCRLHLKEVIRFCFDCTNQLCEDCLDKVDEEHKNHAIYNVENAAKEIRKQTEVKISSLKQQMDKARKQKHELDKHRFSSSDRQNKRREVTNMVSNLASAILAAIEDQQRLDKALVAESVTKLQKTIDIWMEMNRALYKISTAYNDLENIYLFRKYKKAHENPEFPVIRTKAEFPDDRKFRHSELIQGELRNLMDFLEKSTGINVPVPVRTEKEIERLATAYDQADNTVDMATEPISRAPSRLSFRTNTTSLTKYDENALKYFKSENQALKIEISKLRKQSKEMIHATSLLRNFCHHVMEFSLMQEDDILDALKTPTTEDDELSEFYRNISSVGQSFSQLKSQMLNGVQNEMGSNLEIRNNMEDTKSIQTRLTTETNFSIAETASTTINDKVSHQQAMPSSKKGNRLSIIRMYSKLYENEWSDALDTLTQSSRRWAMDLVIRHLYVVVHACFKVCKDIASQQLQDLVDTIFLSSGGRTLPLTDINPLMELRRHNAVSTSVNIKQNILNMEEFRAEFNKYSFTKYQLVKEICETAFFGKCVYLCWCMVLEDPQLCLEREAPKGSIVDRDLYRHYTKGGKTVEYCVFPPLLLKEDGEILVKGVVQAH